MVISTMYKFTQIDDVVLCILNSSDLDGVI